MRATGVPLLATLPTGIRAIEFGDLPEVAVVKNASLTRVGVVEVARVAETAECPSITE